MKQRIRDKTRIASRVVRWAFESCVYRFGRVANNLAVVIKDAALSSEIVEKSHDQRRQIAAQAQATETRGP
jgi:hypothetical protein